MGDNEIYVSFDANLEAEKDLHDWDSLGLHTDAFWVAYILAVSRPCRNRSRS